MDDLCYSGYRYMSKRLEIEEVRLRGLEKGSVLKSTVYLNCMIKLDWECVAFGHPFKMKFNDIDQDHGCKICADNSKKKSFEYVNNYISKQRDVLISDVYENSYSTDLIIKCSRNHIYPMNWNDYQQGSRCPECDLENRFLKYEYVKQEIEKEGETLLSSKYENAHAYLYILCKTKHEYRVSWHNHYAGLRCPRCPGRYRKWQNGVYEQLLKLFPHLMHEQRVLKNYRFKTDVWDTIGRKAVELDGDYWHGRSVTIESDIRKNKEYADAGIRLLRVKYSEYMKDPEGELAKIVQFLS